MKILLVSRFIPYVGGREVMVYELAEHLSKRHKIMILTPDTGRVSSDYSITEYAENGLRKIINKFSPDIINSHAFYLTPGILKVTSNNIPICLTLHGDIFNFGLPKDREMFLELTKKVNKIITVSDHGKLELLKHNISPNLVMTIYNGVNMKVFSKRKISKKKLRESLRLSEQKKIFLTPARAVHYKGLEFLINSIASANFNDKALFLISMPSTRYYTEEAKYLEKLMIFCNKKKIKNIKFGFYDFNVMPLLYNACDAFILPSKSEEFPISILEAFASELPVIATNVGGVKEALDNGKNGFLISYGDKRKLVADIKKIMKGGQNINSMIAKAKTTAIDRFNIKSMVNNYENLYQELIKKSKNEEN